MARKTTIKAAKQTNPSLTEVIGKPEQAKTQEAAVVPEAPMITGPRTVQVRFVLADLGAKQVALSGEFNDWSIDKTRMTRTVSGHWEATLDLAPGRYEYKFVVDGQWVPDPLAHETVGNPHGTLNSVVEVCEGPTGTCNCRSYLRPV
jgi:1,4-alpha-glucan branching enzyme